MISRDYTLFQLRNCAQPLVASLHHGEFGISNFFGLVSSDDSILHHTLPHAESPCGILF